MGGYQTVEQAFFRLADFFDSKDDAPLTASEVSTCLEWLRSISEAPPLPPTTPMIVAEGEEEGSERRRTGRRRGEGTVSSSKIGPAIRQPADMTPVKRQIRELLQATTPAADARPGGGTDEASAGDPLGTGRARQVAFRAPRGPGKSETIRKPSPEKRPAPPVAMTRTAKTILSALTRPSVVHPATPEDARKRPAGAPLVASPPPKTSDAMELEERPDAAAKPTEEEAALPTFHFDIAPGSLSRTTLEALEGDDANLPLFSFE